MRDRVIRPLRALLSTGFFHIVGSGVLNRMLTALLGVALVRILSKPEYGAYAYAFNVASLFTILNGCGVVSALVQICSEQFRDPGRVGATFAYGYRWGVRADVLLGVAILLTGLFAPLKIEGSGTILMLFCAYPLAYLLCEIKTTQLRVRLQNREYALMTNVQTACMVAFSLAGAALLRARGLAVGESLGLLLAYAIMCRLHPFHDESHGAKLDAPQRRDFWQVAGVSAFNNGLSQALSLVGTFLVGALLESDELVASYSVATTIPFALLFVPQLVVTYIVPHFARNRHDRAWTIRAYGAVMGAGTAAMLAITLLVALLADPIVTLVFGPDYLDCVPALRVLMAGFFVTAAFRIPTGNLLVTQRQLSFNALVGIISIAVIVASSLVLIPSQGMVGAALSYDLAMGVGAVLNVCHYLRTILALADEER